MRGKWVLAGLILLTGCDRAAGRYQDQAVELNMVAPPNAPAMANASAPASPTAPRMAYIYRYGMELPKGRIAGVMERHEQACAKAGPATCQVILSSSDQMGGHGVSARLELRADPAWIAQFRSRVTVEATAAGGKVTRASATGEDLTLALTDTEARLGAQTTLRDRLQQLLATRSGDLGELLKVESELARVQGEIDSVQSALAVLRTRVATSRLEIDYYTPGSAADDGGAFQPVRAALGGALGAFMLTVGVLITTLAVTAPIALIAVPLGWWLLRMRRRRRAARMGAGTPTAPPS